MIYAGDVVVVANVGRAAMITQILLFLIHVWCFVAVYVENVIVVANVGRAAAVVALLSLLLSFMVAVFDVYCCCRCCCYCYWC